MKTLILLMIAALITASRTDAKTEKLGVGFILGDPTGLSAKYFLNPTQAFDGALSFGHHEVMLYGNYLKHFPGQFKNKNAFVSALTPYVGVGPVLAFGNGKDDRGHFIHDDDDDFAFGGRIPFGVEWHATGVPLGISLEIAPGLVVLPETNGFVQGGLAFRYYF